MMTRLTCYSIWMRSHPERATEKAAHPVSRGSMVIAAFSTVVEWYDFTLYLYFATVLARVFYGSGQDALLVTLGGFAIAYLMRPLGAVVFGHIGDRVGRRTALATSLLLMTVATMAFGVLPTYRSIGVLAPILLAVVQGWIGG